MMKRILPLSIIALVLMVSSGLAKEQTDCDFDFKAFESDIVRQITPSIILSRKSDGMKGTMQLEIEGVQTFTLDYRACYHTGISIKSSHIDPAYLEKSIDFIRLLISQTSSEMADILESLKPHMAGGILSLEVRDHSFSTMHIEKIHNEDGTLSVEISVSGG